MACSIQAIGKLQSGVNLLSEENTSVSGSIIFSCRGCYSNLSGEAFHVQMSLMLKKQVLIAGLKRWILKDFEMSVIIKIRN